MSSSGLSTMRKPKHHRPSVKPMRVLISAASSITRAGLERLLEKQPSVQLVGAISGANGLPPAIAENDPDVVLLHLEAQSPETNWEELIALEVPILPEILWRGLPGGWSNFRDPCRCLPRVRHVVAVQQQPHAETNTTMWIGPDSDDMDTDQCSSRHVVWSLQITDRGLRRIH